MNPILRRVIGLQEDEAEKGKLDQEKVVYMTPEMLNKSSVSGSGARCGKCIFFNTPKSECFITTPSACNAEHGVCAMFVGGDTFLEEDTTPLQLVPKKAAGYTEDGPTRCCLCEYWQGERKDDPETTDDETATCVKIKGEIQGGGCCNAFERC